MVAIKERVAASQNAAGVDGAEVASSVEKLDESIRYLQSVSDAKLGNYVVKLVSEHALAFGIGALYLLLLISQIAVYAVSPRSIVTLDETLQKLSVKLPDWAGGATISPRYLLFTNLLVRSARVVDRWVAANLAGARSNFERTASARQASATAPKSVKIDGAIVAAAPEVVRGLLDSKIRRVMILGPLELRAGLLDQVARWCLAGELSGKAAIPLWLDRDLQGIFRVQTEIEVSLDFFGLLLARRRIVVMVADLGKGDIRPMAELMTTTFPAGACFFLATDKAPQELLISFARIEVEAASPSPRRRGRPKTGLAQPDV